MSHATADIEITTATRSRRFEDVLVDTGATYSVLDEAGFRELDIVALPRHMRLELGDGRRVNARFGAASVRLAGREGGSLIVTFRGAEPVIGVATLEGLGLAVDPEGRKIIERRPSSDALCYCAVAIERDAGSPAEFESSIAFALDPARDETVPPAGGGRVFISSSTLTNPWARLPRR